jgi:hypothetical protein
VALDEANVCVEGKSGDAGSLADVDNDAVIPAPPSRSNATG